MQNKMGKAAAILLCATLYSCTTAPGNPTNSDTLPATPGNTVVCTEPRPDICTREYRPVCATTSRNIQCVTAPCPATMQKTYATGCTACAEPKVISYKPGECRE